MEVNHIARQVCWYHNVAYQVKSFLPIDILGISEMQKCGLKYVIFSQSIKPTELFARSACGEQVVNDLTLFSLGTILAFGIVDRCKCTN